uniref:Isoform 2 of Zinc finger A20 and AN1 domain-containing stress-associated protein 1 n=1 Tax=Oryza sativa subsp. japonica TaxID=39947 RepID=A3C039-2
MAQRDKKDQEPTELRAPEITLCANSCGFPGNPATQNLCQNCFLAATADAIARDNPVVRAAKIVRF